MSKEIFKSGDKVYSKSMKKNFVIAKREGEFACTVIDINMNNSNNFETYVLSNHDLQKGWT
ncbi:MAG: hypothetical protein LLF98_02400 [Clostridium sp.]|uniref:hypothetical protein n=1 Tax=Clostridium sp. TaxID=1506 RepID=UPI0025C23BAC|nr:hypothetical protein [Clostridium sp.]MCE5220133.1 hypothetical protein [Clostridium sp.]